MPISAQRQLLFLVDIHPAVRGQHALYEVASDRIYAHADESAALLYLGGIFAGVLFGHAYIRQPAYYAPRGASGQRATQRATQRGGKRPRSQERPHARYRKSRQPQRQPRQAAKPGAGDC
jgi:hypothetical protein